MVPFIWKDHWCQGCQTHLSKASITTLDLRIETRGAATRPWIRYLEPVTKEPVVTRMTEIINHQSVSNVQESVLPRFSTLGENFSSLKIMRAWELGVELEPELKSLLNSSNFLQWLWNSEELFLTTSYGSSLRPTWIFHNKGTSEPANFRVKERHLPSKQPLMPNISVKHEVIPIWDVQWWSVRL